jgi:energy-coupling factor transporter ATP-binding protein EcfA2
MQKIKINNFGPISNVTIELGKVTLLIGEQATGKSTVSQLVYFFKSLKEDFFTIIFNKIGDLGNEEKLQDAFFREIRRKFYNFFGSTKHLEDFTIKFYYSDIKTIELSLNPNKALECNFDNSFFKTIISESEQLLKAINQSSNPKNAFDLIAEEQSKSKYVSRLANLVNAQFEDNKTSLYIPAGRIATTNYAQYFTENITLEKENDKKRDEKIQNVGLILIAEFLSKVSNIKKVFGEKSFSELIEDEYLIDNRINKSKLELFERHTVEIIKGRYKNDRYGEKIILDDEGHYIFLQNASSGQQESIRILQDLFLILLNKENVFRVIEEPEAHLYPLSQKKLIELMALVLTETDSEIIVTTHSPYVLSIFNNLLFASKIKHKDFYLESKDFKAYTLLSREKALTNDNKSFESILNEETGLISENFLDDISIELGDEFDMMFEEYKKQS